MIQRKQTLYLLLAFVAMVVCMCRPIGSIEPAGMGVSTGVYNLCVWGAGTQYNIYILFACLLVSAVVALAAVFAYLRRPVQARMCLCAAVGCAVWCIYYTYCALSALRPLGTFHMRLEACLPPLALVLLLLARKGVMDDERLVRAADRIR